ncbi:unnamed protein product [Staurois parvus]|uniref:Uncharacterized protein n=1 Tax=Staurois parvus TaxID=386267 RepID=A0ABN9G1A7_9NEOB|nr:unnamed protein product [Staurois parvus]
MTAGTGSPGVGLSGPAAGIGSPGMTAGTGSSGVGSSGSTAGIGSPGMTAALGHQVPDRLDRQRASSQLA